jgi:membrane-associated phospholipid phosphatase
VDSDIRREDADGGAGGGGLRRPPATWHDLWVVLLVAAVMVAVASFVGWLIVHPLAGSVGDLDDRIARSLAACRTDTLDALTWVGSGSAEAVVKITAAAVLSVLFLRWWRRWNEVALLAGSLILEVSVFSLSSFIVDRPRPPVVHLDSIPPTSSYPSGHVAAAVAFYGSIAIIVWWHTRSRVARGVAITAAIVLPPIVGFSRMYRGMHHASDVVVGAVIGGVSLWVVYRAVRPPASDTAATTAPPDLRTRGARPRTRRRTSTAERQSVRALVPRRAQPVRVPHPAPARDTPDRSRYAGTRAESRTGSSPRHPPASRRP